MQSIALNRTVKSVIVLLALVAAAAVPGFALAYTISPSGGDDTAEIQEALTECAISGENCVIQLQSGQFNVSGLNTTGFRGSLCGGGMDDTIVLAVGSGANADLLRFVDSEVTISDFTIRLPSEISKLDSVIKITGTLGDSRVTRVGIEGYAGEYKATNGVAILGNPSIGGSHQVTNSSINHIQWALVAANTSGAHVRFGGSASKGNTIDYADRAVTTMTMNASQFDLSFNTATNIRGGPGMAIWAHSATTLSHYRIHHNLLEFVGTTPAICVWDRPNGMLPSPPVVTMQVEIMHNTIHMNALSPPPDPAASYWWAIHPWLLDAPLIAQNEVTGSSAIGVYLHGPIQGGVVVRNDLSGFSDLVVPIMLDSGTSNNVVVGGSQPVGVYDLGTNNTLAGGTYPVSP
jgi:hypothetical protein